MKNNKGISMVTLIITIIVMVMIISIAYRIGSRYIKESREEQLNALTTVLSSAVERRQKDKFVGIAGAKSYYAGYHVSSEDFQKFLQVFTTFDDMYEPGLWYIIDAENADDLGVVDAKQFLVSSMNNIAEETDKYIAFADYYTGKVHLLKYEDVKKVDIDISKLTTGEGDSHPTDHEPIWTIATCTEPSVCQICGFENSPALGHDFGGMTEATCTEDMKCIRCGYIAEKAKGHEYDLSVILYEGAKGHYNPCIRCDTAGNFGEHQLTYTIITGGDHWQHKVKCSVCEYEAMEDCHIEYTLKDTDFHTAHCTDCGRTEDLPHDDPPTYRYIDKDNHYVCCESCDSELYPEKHVDVEVPYGICDKCDGEVNKDQKPIVIAKMEKKGTNLSNEEKYVAKLGDIVEITLETDSILVNVPTIKVQNIEIKRTNIRTEGQNKYVATINTSGYEFEDGDLTINVSNIKTIWGIRGDNVTRTSDGKYVVYDGKLPSYVYIP